MPSVLVIQRPNHPKGQGVCGHINGLSGIALEPVDGGTMERISISNIVIEGTSAPVHALATRPCPQTQGP